MRLHTHIDIEPFKPTWNMRSAHTQTIMGTFLRRPRGVSFRRERLDLPDGDFVDIDFADVDGAAWHQLDDNSPIVLMIHGLEGNARSGPAHEVYRYLSNRGVRCLGMNLRSCSGEMNRTARLYHAGATDDVKFVHEWLLARYPDVPVGIVAISLGANMLLKYLGEEGAALQGKLAAAVAISPPFDLLAGAAVMESGMGLFYAQTMLRPLRSKAMRLKPLVDDIVDLALVSKATNFRQFDDAFTAPLHGFASANDYYERVSSKNYLDGIRVPTLLLRAVDDPFFDPADIPYSLVAQHPYLYGGFPQHGGHVGFIEGSVMGQYSYWAERQAARFMALVV